MNHVQAINGYACSTTDSGIFAVESTLPHTCSQQPIQQHQSTEVHAC